MKKIISTASVLGFIIFCPIVSHAQDMAKEISSMQSVLDKVYNDMLPMCSNLIAPARGLAGFGALWYIASRVWRQIASAESIDFYPLLRPFAIGMAIMLFPAVIAVINGVLQPTVNGTADMVKNSNSAITVLLKKKEEAVKSSKYWEMYVGEKGNGDSDKWYKYTHPQDKERKDEGIFAGIGNDLKFFMDKQSYNFRNSIKQLLSQVLEVFFAAASLAINTLRIFYLLLLAIIGPLVFGIAVFDGFETSLTQWFARYVNTFLWLPIANIFGSILGKIQENMLKIDLAQISQQGDTTFSSTDTAYIIFLIIGIIGYFSVPSVANWFVHAHGGNSMTTRVNSVSTSAISTIASTAIAGGSVMGKDKFSGSKKT